MSHQMNHARAHHVEKGRVSRLTKGYASGGGVHKDAAQDKKLIKKMMSKELHAEGDKSKHRMDRPKRAHGGKVGKKHGSGKTIINVITGGDKAAPPPMPMPPPGVGPAAMPPPMAAKPPMAPTPGAGGPPPGMPMRARGGKVQTPAGSGVAANTKGAERNKGSKVFNQSMRNGTQISHEPGKSDLKDMDRGKAVTFKSGGRVRHFYAKGGKVESPQGVASATKLPGGSGGGEARLAKEHRAERRG